MELKKFDKNAFDVPYALKKFFDGAQLFDSSSSKDAVVIFVDKGKGYFCKSAAKGSLIAEAQQTEFFHSLGLSAKVVEYISTDKDWLLTKKIVGDDCIAEKHLQNPTKLCDIIGQHLAILHKTKFDDCKINHTQKYLDTAKKNYLQNKYDNSLFPDNWGYATPQEAYEVIEAKGHLLKTDTLLHGDYCLPNIILNNWKFSGFIDLGNGGVGDKHVDLFWGMWSLNFNLKTDKYKERFFDVYGRDKIDEEMLRIVAAVEVFG